MDINWEDPPAEDHAMARNGDRQRFLAGIAEHPGKWARYYRLVTRPYASSMRGELLDQGYEVRYKISETDPERYDVWIRKTEEA